MTEQNFKSSEPRTRFFKEMRDNSNHEFSKYTNLADENLEENLLFSIYEARMLGTSIIERSYSGFGNRKYLEDLPAGENNESHLSFIKVSELSFEDGQWKSVRQDSDRANSRNRRFGIAVWDDYFSIALEKREVSPQEDLPSNPLYERQDRIQTEYDFEGNLRWARITYSGNYEKGEISVYRELFSSEIDELKTKVLSLPDEYNVGYFEVRAEGGSVNAAFFVHEEHKGDAAFPLHLSLEEVKQEIFPDEEPIAEREVPALRRSLGTYDVPYSRSILLAKPNLPRAAFPRDVDGKIVDLDRVWRSVDLAGIFGIGISREKPIE